MKIKDFKKDQMAFRVVRNTSQKQYQIVATNVKSVGNKYVYTYNGTRYTTLPNNPNANYLYAPESPRHNKDFLFLSFHEAEKFISVEEKKLHLSVKYGFKGDWWLCSDEKVEQVYRILEDK